MKNVKNLEKYKKFRNMCKMSTNLKGIEMLPKRNMVIKKKISNQSPKL